MGFEGFGFPALAGVFAVTSNLPSEELFASHQALSLSGDTQTWEDSSWSEFGLKSRFQLSSKPSEPALARQPLVEVEKLEECSNDLYFSTVTTRLPRLPS